MAPKLTEDEIDDLIYFSRAGEKDELVETIKSLAERETVTPAEIVAAAQDVGKSTSLHMATGNGHLDIVRQLVGYFDSQPQQEKQAFLDEGNEHGNTGLHWAALGGHLDTVKYLLEQGASPALANEANYVPLDLAYFNNHNEVAQFFLKSVEKLETKNEEGGLAAAVESVEIEGGDEEKPEEKKDKETA